MKISLHFFESLYNCDVIITDAKGTQSFFVDLSDNSNASSGCFGVEVFDGDFVLTVIPRMADYRSFFEDVETVGWKGKLANKLGKVLLSSIDKMFLRVGCKYRMTGMTDGDILSIYAQEDFPGMFDKFNLLDLIPMAYMFYEVSCNGRRCALIDAFETNRKEVIGYAKKLAFAGLDLELVLTYPFQVGRIKRLTSNKIVRRKLMKFNQMNEEQRQKYMAKKEKFMAQ